MANPETPRQNSRALSDRKEASSLKSTLHHPPPQTSSSSSSARSSNSPSPPATPRPITSPSNLTSKMRSLWNTSQSKTFLSNLNVGGIATNFPLKNMNLGLSHRYREGNLKRGLDVNLNLNLDADSKGADENGFGGWDEDTDYIDHTKYNHTNHILAPIPIPKLSSPNGKPEISSAAYYGGRNTGAVYANPLSGPSVRHAEYLFSRVEGRFLGPDTPPVESPFGERMSMGWDGSLSSRDTADASLGFAGERLSGEGTRGLNGDRAVDLWNVDVDVDMDMGMNGSDEKRRRRGIGRGKLAPSMRKQHRGPWKSMQDSCMGMLNNVHLSRCDDGVPVAVTGQENGNREVDMGVRGCVGMDDGEDEDEKCDELDVFTERRPGYGSGKRGEKSHSRHRLVHTESWDSMVEIYTSESESVPAPTSPCLSRRFAEKGLGGKNTRRHKREATRNENQFSSALPQHQKNFSTQNAPIFSTNVSLENRADTNIDANPNLDIQNQNTNPRQETQEKKKMEKNVRKAVYASIYPHNLQLQEQDFAFMEMRPMPKTKLDLNTIATNGDTTNADLYQYRYRSQNDDDDEDAKSSLDMEDSLYDDKDADTDADADGKKSELRFSRAKARFSGVGNLMGRYTNSYTNTDTGTDICNPTNETQPQLQPQNSNQDSLVFDADAALSASLSSLARLQSEFEYEYEQRAERKRQGNDLLSSTTIS